MARIEEYAIVGDCRTAALVSRTGSIDWLCWPRFDSDACLAALLGTPGAVGVTDVHEDGDAVALCDRLAQSPVGHGRGCYPAPGIA